TLSATLLRAGSVLPHEHRRPPELVRQAEGALEGEEGRSMLQPVSQPLPRSLRGRAGRSSARSRYAAEGDAQAEGGRQRPSASDAAADHLLANNWRKSAAPGPAELSRF